MALVVHLRSEGRSWRVEGPKESKLEQALGAKPRFAVSDYKRTGEDPKWLAVAFDESGAVAALTREHLSEAAGKLDEFPEIKEAFERAVAS